MPVDPAGSAIKTIAAPPLTSRASLPRWILAATAAAFLVLLLARYTVAAKLGSTAELPALAVACGGSLVALFVAHRRLPHVLDLPPMMAGLALTGLAVCLFDAARSPGVTAASLAANACIVLGTVITYPIILPAFYRNSSRGQALSTAIDGMIVLTAGTTVLLAVWLTGRARSPEPVDYVLPFLGALVLSSALTAVLAALTNRTAPKPRGIWVSIAGLTCLGLVWVIWLDAALRLQEPGPLIAPLYCVGAVLISFGWITWTFEPGGGPTYDRLAGSLADWLPIVGILTCLAVIAYPHGRIDGLDPALIGTAAVILLAIGRQRLLVSAERRASRRLEIELAERAQAVAGAQGHLYESLAQELVGSLGLELREFLVRMSPVEEIDPGLAAVVAGLPEERTRALMDGARRLGLMTHGGATEPWRLNPIVSEYLQARFASEVGRQGVVDLHRRLAATLETTSWRQAARHWAAAGDYAEMRRVIGESILTIVARGDFAAAIDLVTRFPEPASVHEPAYALIRSYELASNGRFGEAAAAVERVAEQSAKSGASGPLAGAVALTRIYLGEAITDASVVRDAIDDLKASGDPELEAIARADEWLWAPPERSPVGKLCAALADVGRLAAQRDHPRLEGLARLRLANAQAEQGDWGAAIESGRVAVARLEAHGLADELASARLALARALAPSTSGSQWRQQASIVLHDKGTWLRPDVLAELAELEALYGDPVEARRIAGLPLPETAPPLPDRRLRETAARIQMLEGDAEGTLGTLADLAAPADQTPETWTTPHPRSIALAARALLSPKDQGLSVDLEASMREAERREEWFVQRTLATTLASISSRAALNRHVHSLEAETAHLSIQAELLARRLADLDAASFELLRREAALRPERWRRPLRRVLGLADQSVADVSRAAELLELAGTEDDIELLQGIARERRFKLPEAGRNLAKRLAPPVVVNDLGRITISIGDRVVDGTDIRRKVLALLAYMLTRPQFTATRDEVIEALWPETDLDQGGNSLNQACHVLRQAMEPVGERSLSPGYVNNKADLIWLDGSLVSSRSGECLRLVSALERDPSPELVHQLVETYTARFAVEFLYEDWASSFRDRLHSSFLAQVGRSIDLDIEAGAYQRAINIARRALAVDPAAEQIELVLVRLYRLIGADDAAAQQYDHYATFMNEQREA